LGSFANRKARRHCHREFSQQQNSQSSIIGATILGHLFSNSVERPAQVPQQATPLWHSALQRRNEGLLNSCTGITGRPTHHTFQSLLLGLQNCYSWLHNGCWWRSLWSYIWRGGVDHHQWKHSCETKSSVTYFSSLLRQLCRDGRHPSTNPGCGPEMPEPADSNT
jgi:hypothetical protein